MASDPTRGAGMWQRARASWIVFLAPLTLLVAGGCATPDCPVGQVRYEGECVDVIPVDTTPECGPGTYLQGGVCWADPSAVCGPNTEVVWVTDAAGVPTREFLCVGQAVSDVPPCPDSPDGERFCVSGRAYYLMDPDHPCDLLQTPITFEPDATAIEVAIFDPMIYAADPTAPPLGVADVSPESGAWKVEDLPQPSQGVIAVAVRSRVGSTGFVLTGSPYAVAPGTNLEGIAAYGVTAGQNTLWSATIGDTALAGADNCSAGETLWDCGTWVGLFGYRLPSGAFHGLAGVSPRTGTGTPMPQLPLNATFYLDESCEGFLQPASLADSYTTDTGVVLMAGATLGGYTGSCADVTPDSECESEGYSFEPSTGGAAPQAFFVQIETPQGLE